MNRGGNTPGNQLGPSIVLCIPENNENGNECFPMERAVAQASRDAAGRTKAQSPMQRNQVELVEPTIPVRYNKTAPEAEASEA
jgi:hypothetical protein